MRTQCSVVKINFPAGNLFKEFRCTFLSSMVSGSCENWLWINCEYHLPDFLFGYLPNVDRSLNGHLPSAIHYGAFLRRCICAGRLACFMAFSTTALKHDSAGICFSSLPWRISERANTVSGRAVAGKVSSIWPETLKRPPPHLLNSKYSRQTWR